MNALLDMKGVTKKYGRTLALNQVSLKVGGGKIVGLLGTNGSGKSTMMKLIAGIASPSSGSVYIDGQRAGLATRSSVSFLPDQSVLESWMRVKDAVAYYNEFYGDFNLERANRMLAFMRLQPEQPVTSLSKGMKERLEVTIALSRDAKLYLLDEPIGGVDPVARDKILDAIVQFFQEDSTLLVSTHLVSDMERIFDEVIFIHNGKLVLQEEVETIRIKHGKSVDQLYKAVFEE